jgi:hypothetical protein
MTGRTCNRNGAQRNAYRILLGKLEGKRPLGGSRRRWVGNIKIDLRETGWDDMEWINMAQARDQCRAFSDTLMNLHGSIKCWEVLVAAQLAGSREGLSFVSK